MQERTGPAADVEHGLRGHHQWQVEAEVTPSFRRMERVIQLGEMCLAEQAIDHSPSLPDRFVGERWVGGRVAQRHASHGDSERLLLAGQGLREALEHPEGEREQVVARESGRRYVDASRSRRGYQRTVSSKCAGCFPSQRTRHVYVPFGNGL